MKRSPVEDGTWTLQVRHHRGDVWVAWLLRESVLTPRFQRARFELEGNATLLIDAGQLLAAIQRWLTAPEQRLIFPVKINPVAGTVEGTPVVFVRDMDSI